MPQDIDVNAASFRGALGKAATVEDDITVRIPVGTGHHHLTVASAIGDIAKWDVPPSSEVQICVGAETIEVDGIIAQWALKSSEQTLLKGQAPLVKFVTDTTKPGASKASFTGKSGNYLITLPLTDTANIVVGNYISIAENDQFQKIEKKRSYIGYDQKRPKWHFTDMQAANDDQIGNPHGYLVVLDKVTPGEFKDCAIYQRNNRRAEWSPADKLIASDFIMPGRFLNVEGQLVEIASVSDTDSSFTLKHSLQRPIPVNTPETYWYTIANSVGTISQTGKTITGKGTKFSDLQVGDFIAQNGVFNPIAAIQSDTSLTTAVKNEVPAGTGFGALRSGGVLAGCHKITAVTPDTVTFLFRGRLPSSMVPPVKGINGGRVLILQSVLKTSGKKGGITVERNVMRLKNIVIEIAGTSGNVIHPAGSRKTNDGHVITEGTVGLIGGNIGIDFQESGTGNVSGVQCCGQNYAGIRGGYDRINMDFAVMSGARLFGILSSGANIYANHLNCSANGSIGASMATPNIFVADSMDCIGNGNKGINIQLGSAHLVQLNALHNKTGLSLANCTFRATGCRLLGGKLGVVGGRASGEMGSCLISGQVKANVQIVGGEFGLNNATLLGSNGLSVAASEGAALAFNGAIVQTGGKGMSFSTAAKLYASGSYLGCNVMISETGFANIRNAEITGNFTLSEYSTAIVTSTTVHGNTRIGIKSNCNMQNAKFLGSVKKVDDGNQSYL